MDEIAEVFEDLDDPRTGNAKRHLLHEILIIALCTVLCGGETCADMALFGRSKRAFLEEFLTLEHGIPATIRSHGCSGFWTPRGSTPGSSAS